MRVRKADKPEPFMINNIDHCLRKSIIMTKCEKHNISTRKFFLLFLFWSKKKKLIRSQKMIICGKGNLKLITDNSG